MLVGVLDAYLSCYQLYDDRVLQLRVSIWKSVQKVYGYSSLLKKWCLELTFVAKIKTFFLKSIREFLISIHFHSCYDNEKPWPVIFHTTSQCHLLEFLIFAQKAIANICIL